MLTISPERWHNVIENDKITLKSEPFGRHIFPRDKVKSFELFREQFHDVHQALTFTSGHVIKFMRRWQMNDQWRLPGAWSRFRARRRPFNTHAPTCTRCNLHICPRRDIWLFVYIQIILSRQIRTIFSPLIIRMYIRN